MRRSWPTYRSSPTRVAARFDELRRLASARFTGEAARAPINPRVRNFGGGSSDARAGARSERLPFENLVAIAAGLAWIAAGEGVFGFVLGAVPGSLMVAGGVASLLLPGDVRTPQLIALGSALRAAGRASR